MPVSRKPKTKDRDVETFIAEGGTEPVTEEVQPAKRQKQVQPIKLRVPAELLAEIDAAVAQRKPPPSRHQWLLEALYEKLERDR
jgi:hypothetical protein